MSWKPIMWGRLSTRSYPELLLFENEIHRRDAVRQFKRRIERNPLCWLSGMLLGAFNAAVIVYAIRIPTPVAVPMWIRYALVTAMLTASAGLASHWLWHKPLQRFLRQQLRERGIHVCLACGYSLTGNTTGVCPECGKQVHSG